MIEKCLIEHCAPTLASLKAANLFNACCEEEENIDLQISMWNQLMNPKGVKLLALRSRGNRSLVYVYREDWDIPRLSTWGCNWFYPEWRTEL